MRGGWHLVGGEQKSLKVFEDYKRGAAREARGMFWKSLPAPPL